MSDGSVISRLYLVDVQQHVYSGVQCNQEKRLFFPWPHMFNSSRGMAKNRPEQSMVARVYVPKGHTPRLVSLRMYIRYGTYTVNSITLARCIIRNETHFLQMHRE